ncbi:hypothetical protein PRUPE_7G032600 [Prunus persica]|uniref:Uncharacterized protein n=1 Tax=Prunus persica TaxID=3760 RepID=A0A251N641_PRUPE|nr:hypothetical protein PRUPE_7G032600 [Prunus persica]
MLFCNGEVVPPQLSSWRNPICCQRCEGGCVRGIPSKCPVELETAWIVHRVLKSLDCAASTEFVVALEHQGVCK